MNFLHFHHSQAVLKGNVETIKFLLEDVKVNVHRKDIFGKTAMQHAGQLPSKEIVQLLQHHCRLSSHLSTSKLNGLFINGDVNMNSMINCKMNCGGN